LNNNNNINEDENKNKNGKLNNEDYDDELGSMADADEEKKFLENSKEILGLNLKLREKFFGKILRG
jgi:hypothetical protein